MPKIIIGNVDNDAMIGDLSQMSASQCHTTASIASRLLWIAEAGDILVMPSPISGEMKRYCSSILDLDLDDLAFIVPDRCGSMPIPLTSDVLLDGGLIEAVRAAMERAAPQDWTIVPYYFTASVGSFADAIDPQGSASGRSFLREGGAELFNDKSFFRKFARARDVSVPDGAVCLSLRHLLHVAPRLARSTGTIILKQEFNGGGDGNAVVTSTTRTMFPGSAQVLRFSSDAELEAALASLWSGFTSGHNTRVTVEVYHLPKTIIYSEFEVHGSGAATYLNHGLMRMEPLWCGFEIPGGLSTGELARFVAQSQALALAAGEEGFRGRINFDAIVLADGRILFNEFNGRLGGCTHIDIVARQLIGPDYLDGTTILTRNKVQVPSWTELTSILDDEDLGFDRSRRRGILILTESLRLNGTIEYMVAAPSPRAALDMEVTFLDALAAARDLPRPQAAE